MVTLAHRHDPCQSKQRGLLPNSMTGTPTHPQPRSSAARAGCVHIAPGTSARQTATTKAAPFPSIHRTLPHRLLRTRRCHMGKPTIEPTGATLGAIVTGVRLGALSDHAWQVAAS